MQKRLSVVGNLARSFARTVVAGCTLAAAAAAVFGAPADVARGVAWLQTQLQAQGQILVESQEAHATQARCETARTLLQLSAGNPQVAELVASLPPPPQDSVTESLACWQQLRQQLGEIVLTGDLDARRVEGQGYTPYLGGHAAFTLDTGWALAAQLQSLSPTGKTQVLTWLQATQKTDGSFAVGGEADLLATATIVGALKVEVSTNTAAASIATKATTYLLGQFNAQGSWLGDVKTTSVVFEAVHPYTGSNPNIASSVNAYLLSQQGPDGSWAGDPYVTAVALRALALTALTPIDPTVAGTSATVRGVVTAASTGQPLAGATLTATQPGSTVKTATSDSNGQFVIQGIPPGAANLSASLSGYQTVSASAILLAGTTINFSPALYVNGAIPTAGGRVSGNVIAFGSNTALSGVTVQAVPASGPAISGTADASGRFDVAVPAGSAVVSFSLTGYTMFAQQVIVTNGSAVNLGSVPLQPVRQTSTLRGTVYDYSGQPLAGAAVQVGTTSATTNSGGAYSLAGLIGTSFTAEARAAGYATQSAAISAPQPGDLVQDFALPATGAGYLTLSDLQLSTVSAGLRQDVTATVLVTNTSAQSVGCPLSMQVRRPDGSIAANVTAVDPANHQMLSSISLPPGQQFRAAFTWNTGSNAPGPYGLTARLLLPGSVTYQNPAGTAAGTLHGQVDIVASPHFIGSVTATPPVAVAGATTPIGLSALIQNDGNTFLPAKELRLALVNTSTGATAASQSVSAGALQPSQLQPLAFANWTPPSAGGNFRIELTSPSAPGSLVTSTLYIGAGGQGSLAVDRTSVSAGTQTVRATVNVSGQNTFNGTVADPLAPLIKQALTTAVNFGDNAAYNENFNKNCFACHVQTQAIAAGERSLKYTPPVDALRRAVVMSSITARAVNPNAQAAYGSYEAGAIGPQATIVGQPPSADSRLVIGALALWATSQWHDPAAVNFTKARFARYMMARQNATDGTWTPDDTASWWGARSPLAAVTLGSLLNVRNEVQLRPQSFTGKATRPLSLSGGNWPAGTLRSTVAANGTIYFAVQGQGVWSRSPSGVLTRLLPDSTHAWAVQALQDGRLAVGTDSGVWIWDSSGGFNKLANLLVYTIKQFPNGDLLVLGPWWDTSGKVYRVSLTGNVQVFINNGPVMSGTVDATFMPDGTLLTLNDSNKQVWRFSPQGALIDSPIPRASQGSLYSLTPYQGGLILSANNGFFVYNKDWVAQRLLGEYAFGVVQMPDGRVVANYAGGGLQEMIDSPADLAGLTSQIDTTFNKAAAALKNDGIVANPSNNVEVAFRLMALGSAKTYYQGTARYTEFDSLMQSIAQTLRSRQRPDGGWVWREGAFTASDSMVTAIVGVALDTQNPSPNSPEVRNAIQFLLSPGARSADGTWLSQNGLATTAVNASTWVEIWLPTMLDRLATLDSTLSLTFAPNVAMNNPDLAPGSSTTGPDGSTTYQWAFTTASDSPGQVAFDLTLANMQVDEERAVAREASLLFKNSFTGETVTQAIAVPSVAVATNLTGTVATDKPVYTEADQATFIATVRNAGTQSRNAQVRFSVLDAVGHVVQVLSPPPAVSVEGGASATGTAVWPTAGILAGPYRVKAELISSTSLVYATSTATFSVTASQQQASGTRMFTDRVSYSAAQVVQLTSRVMNSTANTLLESAQAITEVRNAGGQSVFSRTESIEQLAAGGNRQYGYSLSAGSLAAGNYSASLQLVNSAGSVLSQSTASFTVLGVDQTGVGLVGQMQATPGVVLIGQATQLGLLATNTAASGLTNVPVTVRVIDPVSGNAVASFSSTVTDWAAGQAKTLAYSWTAMGSDGQVLVAAAAAQVNGRDIALGQATVRLVGTPKLQFEPAQLNFTPIYVGENARQTVTLSSIGTIPISSLTFSIGGADASQFAIPQGGCTGTSSLAVGATCTLTISWRPQSVGSQAGEVRIGYTGGEALSVALAGQAKPVLFTGTVAADPREVEAGQSVGLSYSVSNPATVTSQMAGTLSVQSAGGQAVGAWPLDLNVGGLAIFAGGQPYATQPQVQTLTVVLSQNVGTSTAVLATTTFTVIDPPAPVDVNTGTKGAARILVLVSCPPGLGSADDAACVAQRAQAITNYLHALGYTTKVVTTRDAFVAQMRCGSYDTYWVSGGAIKLDEQSVSELRAAVWRGEALWMDGVHDSRNQLLHDTAGVKVIGKLSAGNQVAQISEGVYPAQALGTLGQVTKFELTRGVAQGLFTQVPGNQAPVPAIVSNDYGRGKSLLFAFDLAAMLTADAMQADAQLRGFVSASASHAASGSPTLTLGDVTQLSASVSNTGTRTVAFRVEAMLPLGLSSVSTSPTAQLTTNSDGTTQAIWSFTLSGRTSQEIGWLVRAMQAGSFSVPLSVYSLPPAGGNSSPQLRATRNFTLDVKDAQSLLQQAQAAVNALAPTASSDKSNKTKAVNAVTQALALHAQGGYEQAIAQWLAAADALIGIGSVDTTAARNAVALAIEASTDALCMQRCGSAACQ